jgi:hypothetical protein
MSSQCPQLACLELQKLTLRALQKICFGQDGAAVPVSLNGTTFFLGRRNEQAGICSVI